jgi:hypothetical protein
VRDADWGNPELEVPVASEIIGHDSAGGCNDEHMAVSDKDGQAIECVYYPEIHMRDSRNEPSRLTNHGMPSRRSADLKAKNVWKKWESCFFYGCVGLCATASLNFATKFVPEWGRWYSSSTNLRWQTDAILRGHVTLDSVPIPLRWDLVWDHGIQQVWGLGVTSFRLVFEIIVKAFGFDSFPDKVTFLIAYFICSTCLIATFFETFKTADTLELFATTRKLCMAILLLFAPPFVTLLRTRFEVYEEIVAYGYLYSLISFASLLWVADKPSTPRLLLLSTWSGVGAIVRPTLLFYGIVTLMLGVAIARRNGKLLPVLLATTMPFSLCSAMLCYSNWRRFGAVSEFGHSLNVGVVSHNIFSLKFGSPFQHEPFLSALRDDLGSLFFNKQLNGFDFYKQGCVFGQSPTERWHEMYFTSFDISYLALFVLSCLVWVMSASRSQLSRTLFQNGRKNSIKPGVGEATFEMLGLPWAIMTFVCLFAFYFRSPSMSSRYNIDLLPSVVVAIAALFSSLFNFALKKRRAAFGVSACIASVLWIVFEGVTAKISPTHIAQVPLDAKSIHQAMLATERGTIDYSQQFRNFKSLHQPMFVDQAGQLRIAETGINDEDSAPGDRPVMMPAQSEYQIGDERQVNGGIPFNGTGWNLTNGSVDPAVILFARDPGQLTLSLFSPDGATITQDDIAPIQAKIGLEYLRRQYAEVASNRATIVFDGPHRNRYKDGIQVCFLGFIRVDDLGKKVPALGLKAVSFAKADSTLRRPLQ